MSKNTAASANYTSNLNRFKIELTREIVPPSTYAFAPLRSWPARPHPQQTRIDAFRAIPSRWQ